MVRALLVVFALAVVGPAAAETITVEAALERFYTEELKAEWFSPSFLAQVPFAQLAPVRQQVTGALGEFQRIERSGSRWMAVFEQGSVPTEASLDVEGRFVGLFMRPPVMHAESLDEVESRFDALPGEGSLLVRVDGEARLAHRVDEAFAVGSAFKLIVLKALSDQIEAGERVWSDVVEFDAYDRGLGIGTLGNWPDRAPITLYTLAALMIAESDNAATDALIRELGRGIVEAADPSDRNRPFPTTLEAFKLKGNANELERWRAGDEESRRRLLGELVLADAPNASIFAEGTSVATDVEWFYTANELCDLIASVAYLDLMGINPGVVDGGTYERVAYKGGSEPGVLNMTTWVRTDDGREICVCATANAETVIDTVAMAGVVTSAFGVVEE